jgi:hypothetical protein
MNPKLLLCRSSERPFVSRRLLRRLCPRSRRATHSRRSPSSVRRGSSPVQHTRLIQIVRAAPARHQRSNKRLAPFQFHTSLKILGASSCSCSIRFLLRTSRYWCSAFMTETSATPNTALQRTAPGVTVAASNLPPFHLPCS